MKNFEAVIIDQFNNGHKHQKITLMAMVGGKPLIRLYSDDIHQENDFIVHGNTLINKNDVSDEKKAEFVLMLIKHLGWTFEQAKLSVDIFLANKK